MESNFPAFRPWGADPDQDRPLIENCGRGLLVGYDDIDDIHHEFVRLVNALGVADDREFKRLFFNLVGHTKVHFEFENSMMAHTGFPGRLEHQNEHQRLLSELQSYRDEVEQGTISSARNYVCSYLPGWFQLHVLNMDSTLAAHLEKYQQNRP